MDDLQKSSSKPGNKSAAVNNTGDSNFHGQSINDHRSVNGKFGETMDLQQNALDISFSFLSQKSSLLDPNK
ncbi:hypothetical protein D5086_000994 [Populus alba]|uniref:Uncharacterized protein n=1 Tax=Populus alba TaxID=43335 RepID=A0ACC4CY48_POPAL